MQLQNTYIQKNFEIILPRLMTHDLTLFKKCFC